MTEQITQRRYDTLYQSKAVPIPAASALPTTGSREGDRISVKLATTFTNAASNARWELVYDATDAYWYPIAAAPLVAIVAAAESITNASYSALTTAGPSLTVPINGDYTVEIGAGITCPTTDAAEMSFDIGGTGAVDADYCVFAAVGGTELVSAARLTIHTGLTALNALVSKYRCTPAGTATFEKRWMRLTPLRVR